LAVVVTVNCFVGRISLGFDSDGKRLRRSVRGRTKTEVKDKLEELRAEIKAGIHTPATYSVRQCVEDWLDSLTLDPVTVAEYRGQAEKWIYPKLGATKLKDFKATDADRFFKDLGKVLGKRSLMMIKSTLRRSIRRAQVQDLIGKNVVELVDLPAGQPGRPSRAMTEEQAGKVLKVAVGRDSSFVKVVKLKGRYGATHAARQDGELACGNRPRTDAPVTEIDAELKEVTCRACRSQLGIDDNADATVRLEALFVLSITVGLRPGELRKLTWDLVDLDAGVIHVWRSARGAATSRRRNPSDP
jgi:integrase